MSYRRGHLYVWVGFACPDDDPYCERPDHEHIHLWVREPCEEAGVLREPEAYDFTAGLWLRMDAFDELVVMRMAQLSAFGLVEQTERQALARWRGNADCQALRAAVGEQPKEER